MELSELKKDDKDWLDMLTGKSVPDASPDTLHEAHALRVNLKMSEIDIPEPDGLPTVLDRLEAAGYLKPKNDAPEKNIFTRWRGAFNGVKRVVFERYLVRILSTIFTLMLLPGVYWYLRPDSDELQEGENILRKSPVLFDAGTLYATFRPEELSKWLHSELGKLNIETKHKRIDNNKWSVRAYLPENISHTRIDRINKLLDSRLTTYYWERGWQVLSGEDFYVEFIQLSGTGLNYYVYEHFTPSPQKEAVKLQQLISGSGGEAKVSQRKNSIWRVDIYLSIPLTDSMRDIIGDYNLNKMISPSTSIHVEFVIENTQ